MALRTYTTGLSLKHFPQNERRSVKRRLAAIVLQLSDENTKHCQKHAHEVVNYLIDQDIDNHCVMDPVAEVNGGKGKYGVNELMKKIGNAKNHLHSGYHQLLTSCKGYIDRVNKVREIFEFMNDNQKEFISWILWQRSTYANRVFAKKWNVKFWYVDNLMRGVHNSYFGNIKNNLPCFVRDPSEKEFIDAIDVILSGFNNDLTNREKAFVNKLKKLKKLKTIGLTGPMDPMELSFIPTGWKHLKMWVDNLDLHRSWMPVFRSILSQVYLLDYKGMINKIKTAKVTELLRIPFQKDERKNNKNNKNNKNTKNNKDKKNYKNKLSYQMVSGPKYVIRRENNTKSLDLMRKQGYFVLQFKFLEDKWKDAIAVRVKPSRKMRVIIYKEITLRSMVVHTPRSNDVDIQLIFEGDTENFISTDHLKKKISVNKVDTIGIDINRRGEYAVVSNLDVELPDEIVEQSRRWNVVLDKISHLQYLQDKTDNSWRKSIYGFQIGDLHNRKKNLRKDYHLRLANWVGLQMVSSGADKLVIEDLDIRTYGTRGALAKAIESMADDTSLYAREVLAVRKFTGKYIELVKTSAYNSSRIHVDCGGRLKRDYSRNQYDIAPCSECGKMVNTHKNAAIYLVSTLSGPQNPDIL
ncbi:MAG: hypothetical protein HeimC2_28760 [Candidatus Heimdallarchaeota archaeon LC_2]|nr:MAG: hypothetical protein HeimC2_28760 [Candidatus Heimdallarchaeota archaeon LC_2]